MNRKPFLWAVIVIAVGFVVFRTQRNARREMEQGREYVSILERTANGHPEYYTNVIPLVAGFTKPGERINWYASVFADPSKPPFFLNFSNVVEPRDEWEAAAKKPIAMIADGRRHVMEPYQALASDDGKDVVMVSVGGPRSILAKVVAATNAEIEFGGRRFTMSEKALANCRELLNRSEAAAKKQK